MLARREDSSTAILYEDEVWSYREYVAECSAVANLLLAECGRETRAEGDGSDMVGNAVGEDRETGRADTGSSGENEADKSNPFHVGVLLDNGPHFSSVLGAASLCGAVVAGINPTRRGSELVRDVTHTECQMIITESRYLDLLEPVAESVPGIRIFDADSQAWAEALQPYRDKPAPDVEIDPAAPYLLLFTSGTTGQPKAAICSQQRIARIGGIIAETQGLTSEDVCYQCMPMFHSNALMAGWSPCIVTGATGAFRRKFSASGWLEDVRKFGATYFNYVGKPLTYIMATPPRPDDADNPLRAVFGNEGAPHDLERFAERFGVAAQDSYGSTEGGFGVSRTPDTPPGALGKGDDQTKIYDADTGEECPPAVFAQDGSLANAEECIGEIVHLRAVSDFEGYWNNPEADEERTREGIYWSGDLGYMDAEGFVYFAGRNFDWLRVDGENFAAAPLERILVRHEDIDLAAVYAVPNSDVGDDVMAAVIHRPGAAFNPDGFAEFLAAQSDLGTKWIPKYVQWAQDLPKTETMKILKRVMRAERWEVEDEVWLRDGDSYRLLTAEDVAAIRDAFAARDRLHLL